MKHTIVLCVFSICLFLFNCSDTTVSKPPIVNENTLTISIQPIGNITASQSKVLQGLINTSSSVSNVSTSIIDSSGTIINDSSIYIICKELSSSVDLSSDSTLTITTRQNACNGNYIFVISLVCGKTNVRDSIPFTIVGGSECNAPPESISIIVDSIHPIISGTSVSITGSIISSSVPHAITFNIVDSNDSQISGGVIYSVGSFTLDTSVNLATDAQLKITAIQNICSGHYKLKIDVAMGTISKTISTAFTVVGGIYCNQSDTLQTRIDTLGSWQNSEYGSAFDADSMKIYPKSVVIDSLSQLSIDAVFSYIVIDAQIMSPYAAAGLFTQNWKVKNQTKFKRVSVNIDTIANQRQLAALWSNVQGANCISSLKSGDVIIVLTSQSNYKIIKFISLDPTLGSLGKAIIQGKY